MQPDQVSPHSDSNNIIFTEIASGLDQLQQDFAEVFQPVHRAIGSISFLGQPAEFLLEERNHVGTTRRLACVVPGFAIAQPPTQARRPRAINVP